MPLRLLWPRPPSPTIWSPPPSAPASGEHVVMGAWVKTEREQGKGSFAFLELKKGGAVFVQGAGAVEAKKGSAASGSTAAAAPTAMACRLAVCSASALPPPPLVCAARWDPRRRNHIALLLAVSHAAHLLPCSPPNSLAVVDLLPPAAF
uniref:OB domain-containing protein n=1 Tax=Oryza meridionalis TaxID=40149 RepID=A0A0E0DNI5_9ORYZ